MQPAAQIEFVAFGVAAEIIVVVEDENAAVARVRAVEMRGGETADAPAHDDEIVFFARVRRRRRGFAVAQCMSGFEGARMTAAHAGEQRGVVAGRVLCGRGRSRGRGGCGCGCGDERIAGESGGADGDAVQEIAASDGAIHAEHAVSVLIVFHDFPGMRRYERCGKLPCPQGTCQYP